jgi:hypothetical protein
MLRRICPPVIALLATSHYGCLSSAEAPPAAADTGTVAPHDTGTPSTEDTSPTPTTDAGGDTSTPPGDDPKTNTQNVDALKYRDLATHPGCSTAGLETRAANAYKPAVVPGYKCAAKEYPFGATPEDKSKPIVILVHGNSSTPADWEKFPADTGTPMVSEQLVALGFHTYAVDFRYDLVDDPKGNNTTENAAQNFDHTWATPILEHFIESVLAANPGRQISIAGFSLGPSIVRDSLRRLHRKGINPFSRIRALVLGAGANHGVSSFRALCASNPTMRGTVACQLGDRTSYTPTDFFKGLNGPDGAFETPCLDGLTAFGQTGVCGGNKVAYTTVVMKDVEGGTYQDEFVSEASSKLKGADNRTVGLSDTDPSGYFYKGLFKSHYGAIRSDAGLKIVLEALSK